jgi:hypothetical protein
MLVESTGAIIKVRKLDVAIPRLRAVVQGGGAGRVALPAGANAQDFVGVSLYDGAAGEEKPILITGGLVLVTAAAAFAACKYLQIADNQGRFQAAAPAAGANAYCWAYSLEAATAAGDEVLAMIVRTVLQG